MTKPTVTDSSSNSVSMNIVGESSVISEVKDYLLKVALTDSTVFITGDTGTGKQMVAEQIHRNSSRSVRPFVCVNCAAIPESLVESEMFGYERGAFTGAVTPRKGKFELAGGGTVFLDEIGDMSLYAQAKILRAIENKESCRLGSERPVNVDIRVIAATNKNPERLVSEGKFREDLFYRLNVARFHMPPLRDRKEDIPSLIAHNIERLNIVFNRRVEGVTKEALSQLLLYDWPGNVRELRNVLEATFINMPSRNIDLVDLPKPFRDRLLSTQSLPEKERDRLLSALLETNWNKSKAAQKLHWSRMTLYRKMAKYHIVSHSKT